MTKLMVIPKSLKIDNLLDYTDAFLFGIKDMSINMPIYLELEKIKKVNEILKKNNKKLFVSLNKNMHNNDLQKLEEILIELAKLDIAGILYYDVAILNIVKRLDLNLSLVWSSEHFTTNYKTVNFWKEMGTTYTYLSAEITLDEIIEISKNTDSKLIVPIFGYLPIFASERHTVKNYLANFNLKDNSKINYMSIDNNNYPIIDDKLGTNIYSAHILNGYHEYMYLEEHNIDYITLNSFNIAEDKFLRVVKMFKNYDQENESKINDMFSNDDKGFLYKETIYKVKKDA